MSRGLELILSLFLLTPHTAMIAVADSDPAECYKGPSSCDFQQYSWCDWDSDKGWLFFFLKRDESQHFAGLDTDKSSGRLWSRRSCSTQGKTSCLSFDYSFDEKDVIDLSVYVMGADDPEAVQYKLWSSSSSIFTPGPIMDQASVAIKTYFDYVVVFEATKRRRSGRGSDKEQASVYVDDIKFKDSGCLTWPRKAAVDTEITPPTTTTTTTTTTTIFPSTIASTHPGTEEEIVTVNITFSKPPSTESGLVSSSAPQSDRGRTDTDGGDLSMDSTIVYAIVGAVIGAVVVIVVCVAVFVLYRRKKLSEPSEKDDVSSTGEFTYVNHSSVSSPSQNTESPFNTKPRPQETTVSVDQTETYYNLIHCHDSSETSNRVPSVHDEYAVVNKGSKKQNSPPQDFENIYHILEENGDGIYHNIDENQTSAGSCPPNTSRTNSKKDTVTEDCYNYSKKDTVTEDCYNVLNFDANGKGVQRYKLTSGEDSMVAVYSHLNEGVYNEVDRNKKTKAIDDEYSHIH